MNFWPFKKKKKPAPTPTPAEAAESAPPKSEPAPETAAPPPSVEATAPPPLPSTPAAETPAAPETVAPVVSLPGAEIEDTTTPSPAGAVVTLPTSGEASSEDSASSPAETSAAASAELPSPAEPPPAEGDSVKTTSKKPAFIPPVLAPEPPKYGTLGSHLITPAAPQGSEEGPRKFSPPLAPEPPKVTLPETAPTEPETPAAPAPASTPAAPQPPALAQPSIGVPPEVPTPPAAAVLEAPSECPAVVSEAPPVADTKPEEPEPEPAAPPAIVSEAPEPDFEPTPPSAPSSPPVVESLVTGEAPAPLEDAPPVQESAAASEETTPAEIAADAPAEVRFTVPMHVPGFTLNSDGTWAFDASHPAYQHLQLGDIPVTLTIPIVADPPAADPAQGTSQHLVLCLQGTVGAPVIGGVTQVVRYEGDARVSGHFINVEGAGGDTGLMYFTSTSIPGFTLEADGTYLLDPIDPAYSHLQPGETQLYTVPVALADAGGVIDTKELVICIAGGSMEPQVESVSAHDARGSGSILRGALVGSPTGSEETEAPRRICETRSVVPGFSLKSDGTWMFASSHPSYEDLRQGSVQTITIPVTVEGGSAGNSPQARAISITLLGTASFPALSAVVADADPEGRSVQGSLAAQSGDFYSYSYLRELPPGFSLGVEGTWRFEATPESYGHLASGYTENIEALVRAEDSRGQVESTTITITIHGTTLGPSLGAVSITSRAGDFDPNLYPAETAPEDQGNYDYLFEDTPHPGHEDDGYLAGGEVASDERPGETSPDADQSFLLDSSEGGATNPDGSAAADVNQALENLGYGRTEREETTHSGPRRESIHPHPPGQ